MNSVLLGIATLAFVAVVHAEGPFEPLPVPDAPRPGPDFPSEPRRGGPPPRAPQAPETSGPQVRMAPEGKACTDVLRALIMPAVSKAAKRAAALYPIDAPNAAVRALRDARDGVRRWLQRRQGHELYPVIAIDDATPIRARALAQEIFGKLDPARKDKQLLDFAEIQDDFRNTIFKNVANSMPYGKVGAFCYRVVCPNTYLNARSNPHQSNPGVIPLIRCRKISGFYCLIEILCTIMPS